MIPIAYNMRSIFVRKAVSMATMLGLGLVVFVFASTLMLANGLKSTLQQSAAPDVALVLRKGATSEIQSIIKAPDVATILADPALPPVEQEPRGAGEIVMAALLEKNGAGGLSNVSIRGVTEASFQMRPNLHIVDGRKPAGASEVMVGTAIRGRFRGFELGQHFELAANRQVEVVGIFSEAGASTESEVWTDTETVRTTFKREGLLSTVRVRVPPKQYAAFEASLESNRALDVEVIREAEYYTNQSEGIGMFVSVLGVAIALLLALGAMLFGMTTMYTAVSSRLCEVGVLSALGFTTASIWSSFMLESILLSLMGAGAGVAAASMLGLMRFSLVNPASFSEIVFSFKPTPGIVIGSLVFGAAIGMAGGLLPAVRAGRVSPADVMRE